MKDQRGILSVMTTIAWLVRNVHWRKAPRRGPGIWADWRKRVTYLAQSRSFWSNLRQSGLIWTNLANRLEIVPARAPFGKGVKNMQENLSKVVFSRSVLRIVWGGTWNTLQKKPQPNQSGPHWINLDRKNSEDEANNTPQPSNIWVLLSRLRVLVPLSVSITRYFSENKATSPS